MRNGELLLLGAAPRGEWPTLGVDLARGHSQIMKGAMTVAPHLKWTYHTGMDVEACGAAVYDRELKTGGL